MILLSLLPHVRDLNDGTGCGSGERACAARVNEHVRGLSWAQLELDRRRCPTSRCQSKGRQTSHAKNSEPVDCDEQAAALSSPKCGSHAYNQAAFVTEVLDCAQRGRRKCSCHA
jgi:hypothetical protein